jgi:hypothetical protein
MPHYGHELAFGAFITPQVSRVIPDIRGVLVFLRVDARSRYRWTVMGQLRVIDPAGV